MISEKDFQANVVALAKASGWKRIYHTWDSRRSEKGFPDLVMLRGERLLVAELKTERGRVRPEQHEWLDAFAEAGVETHIWRPSDMVNIAQVLGRKSVYV